MFNVGTPELLVILLVALIILGPQRLPEAARQLGKAMAELRRLSGGFQAEMREAMDSVSKVGQDPPLETPIIHPPIEGIPEVVDVHERDIQEPGGADPTP
ncbi:MAG: twin-arginine translocase subunit TatB [Acidobacteria bacterium]|nr:twin-arginine translocase subunit TatB [Acidobacteriota bacterium]